MRRRRFGNTGLEISEVVFGGGAVGGILIDADDDTRRAAIRIAIDGGINWIDTAAAYGSGRSEEAIGWLLQELDETERPYISTKTAFDREAGDFPGQAERAITDSLQRLQQSSVDLYQVHNRITSTAGVLPNALTPEDMLRSDGVADAMDRLVSKGLASHIGFTATGEASAIHEVMKSGRFESAQIYYNLLNPSAGREAPEGWSAYDQQNIIGAAADNGIAVMVIRVFAAGIIATDVRTGKEGGVIIGNSIDDDDMRMRAVIALLKPEHGERAQVALRYALRNQGVSGVVVGMARLEHLRLAIGAAEMGPLPSDLLNDLDELIDTDFGRLPR